MAGIAMHQAVVKVDATVGATALTDISAGVIGCTLNINRNVGTHHTIGNDWAQRTVGGKDGSGTLRIRVEKETATAYDYLVTSVIEDGESDRRTLEIYTPDATSNSLKFSGEAVFGNVSNAVNATGGSGDAQVCDIPFSFDGTVTFDVVM